MDVSVIIVSYNSGDLLLDCLESLYIHTCNIDFEIIIVDNLSTDETVAIIKTKFPKITIIENTVNMGFGCANNIGYKKAKGRNIFFLNPDTVLLNNAVKVLSDYLDKHSKVGICGGNLFDADFNFIHSHSLFKPSIYTEFDNLLGNKISLLLGYKNIQNNLTDNPIEVAYVTGADMMVKGALVDKFGGFDKDFFMYYEESEFCYRIKKNGYSIMNVPQAKIMHLESKSIPLRIDKYKRVTKGRNIYYAKVYSKKYKLIANLLYVIYMIMGSLIFFLIGKIQYSKFMLHKIKIFLSQ